MGWRERALKDLLRVLKSKSDLFIGGNGKVVGNREESRVVNWKVGKF